MTFDWTQIAGALVVLFGAALLYQNIRHRPQATKEIQTSADLERRISGSSYTLVQLFAPL